MQPVADKSSLIVLMIVYHPPFDSHFEEALAVLASARGCLDTIAYARKTCEEVCSAQSRLCVYIAASEKIMAHAMQPANVDNVTRIT